MDRTEHTSDWRRQPDLSPRMARRIDALIPPHRPTDRPHTLITVDTFIGGLDLIAVEHALNGAINPRILTRSERQATARLLLTLGYGPMIAAARSGLPEQYLRTGDPDSPLHIPRPRRPQGSRSTSPVGSAA